MRWLVALGLLTTGFILGWMTFGVVVWEHLSKWVEHQEREQQRGRGQEAE